MLHYLTIGTILGLSAGFSPGPLLTLVISESLQHGIKSGIKVALAPILTDSPIIAVTLMVLAKLSAFHSVLGIISLLGGGIILYMGLESIRAKPVEPSSFQVKPKPVTKGILVNALSPHPYLFWFSVGAPTVTKAMTQSILSAVAFVGGFYVFLVGSKIVLAIFVGKSRSFLAGNAYLYTMRFLGILLCLLAILLFRDGLSLLNAI
jgi:threonine/homoserine/homoserine lactone efflux protein